MGRIYVVCRDKSDKEEKHEHCHFDEHTAKEAVSHIKYTDKSGIEHMGAHWTVEQIETATAPMKFPEGTTGWDKYVAFNSFYADTCKVLDEASILRAAHAFYFADDDAPKGKVKKYIEAMQKH